MLITHSLFYWKRTLYFEAINKVDGWLFRKYCWWRIIRRLIIMVHSWEGGRRWWRINRNIGPQKIAKCKKCIFSMFDQKPWDVAQVHWSPEDRQVRKVHFQYYWWPWGDRHRSSLCGHKVPLWCWCVDQEHSGSRRLPSAKSAFSVLLVNIRRPAKEGPSLRVQKMSFVVYILQYCTSTGARRAEKCPLWCTFYSTMYSTDQNVLCKRYPAWNFRYRYGTVFFVRYLRKHCTV